MKTTLEINNYNGQLQKPLGSGFNASSTAQDVIKGIDSVNFDSIHEFIETKMDIDQLGILLIGPLPEGPTEKWLRSL